MLHHFNIDALDQFLRVLMGNETIFGEKLLVICGDFRQILPVIPGGNVLILSKHVSKLPSCGNMLPH